MAKSKDSSPLNRNEKTEDETNSVVSNEDASDNKSEEENKSVDDTVKDVQKRQKSEDEKEKDDLKRQKSDHSEQPNFLDILKSVVKEDSNPTDTFNVLTNTKEYDCPIAKLAKMNPGDGFLKVSKTEDASTYAESVFEASEEVEEPENKETSQVLLESSMSENETLLQEIKECKLSVYKGSEWTMPVPVVTHLIQNKDSNHKRVVCFQVGTGRLLLNTVLLPTMSFNKLKAKSIIFSGQTLGENSSLVPHRLLFSDSTVRDEFHELYSK